MPEFLIVEGLNKGSIIPVLRRRVRIGRGKTADVQISDLDISREHTEVFLDSDGRWKVQDLGSTNQTWLNGLAIPANTPMPLNGGDTVRFGNTTIRFQLEEGGRRVRTSETGGGTESALTIMEIRKADYYESDFIDHALEGIEAGGASVRERVRRELTILRDVSQTLASILDLDELLARILKLVHGIIKPDLGVILLHEPESETPEARVWADPQGIHKVRTPLEAPVVSSNVLARAFIERVSVLSNEVPKDFDDSLSIQQLELMSALCVPFVYQDRCLGALYMHNRRAGSPLTQEHLELATSVCNLTAVAIENAKLVARIRDEERLRGNLERYFSPGVVEEIIRQRGRIDDAGRRDTVSILMADIRGFTQLAERMAPDELLPQLNEYLSVMVQLVFEHGGTIDKFIGDAVLAYFGGVSAVKDDADRALSCARDMQERIAAMNVGWRGRGMPELHIGIGLNRGEVVIGNVGSEKRKEFTILGDAVNVASRISGLANAGQIILTESLLSELPRRPTVESLEPVRLKGRQVDTVIYSVLA